MDMLLALFNSIFTTFQKGGIVMYIILLFSVNAMALCAERWRHYKKQRETLSVERESLLEELKSSSGPKDNQDTASSTPAGRIAAVARMNRGIVREELSDKLRNSFLQETAKIERYLNTIAVTASLLPMLGLLGTVVGMVTAFNAIAQYGTGDPKIVAGGISQALLTTEAGLITAIPLIYLHSVLSSKANNIIMQLDEFSSQVLHICSRKELQ